MRTIIFLGIIFLFPASLKAQADTVLLNNLQDKAKAKINDNLDSSLYYGREILNYSSKNDAPLYQSFALNWIGLVYMYSGIPDSADYYFNQSIAFGEKNEAGRYPQLARFNISVNLLNQGKYEEAIEKAMLALDNFKVSNDSINISRVLYHIGSCHFYLNQLDRAKNYFDEAVVIAKKYDSVFRQADIYSALGSVFYMKGLPDSSLVQQKISISLKVNAGGENLCGPQYLNVADIYMGMGLLDSAKFYFARSLNVSKQFGDKQLIGVIYTELSTLFQLNEQLDSSLYYAIKAVDIYEETKDGLTKKLAYFNLANAYEMQLQFDSSLYYYKIFTQLKDSLENANVKAQIAEFDEKYQSAEKDEKILQAALLAEKQHAFNQRQLFVIIGLLVVLSVVLLWFYYRKKQHKTKLNLEMANERNRIAMDLHDHVGAELTLISSKLDSRVYRSEDEKEKNDLERISNQVRQVNSTLRETVWSIQNESISGNELKDKVDAFVFSLFEGNPIELKSICYNEMVLNPQQALSYYRICQEGITNIFKYAEASRIDWSISKKGAKIELILKDNGKGFDQSLKNLGFGLNNMKIRSEKIGADLAIKSKLNEGTELRIVQSI
jgi:signal transduction histidine kinase